MCCKGNLLYCISVETTCLVLSIINVIINLISLMWYILVWGVIVITYINRDNFYEMDYFDGDIGGSNMDIGGSNMDIGGVNIDIGGSVYMDIRTWKWNIGHVVFYFCLIPLASLMTAIFSFFLCIGIINRRPGQVKAYLVYGAVITVLGALASIVLLFIDSKPHAGLWVLFVCAIHSLFLSLVLMTHRKLSENSNYSKFADNIRLVVEDDRIFKSGAV